MRAVLPVIIVVVLGSLGVFAVSPSDYKSAAVFQQMGALMKTHGESLVKVKCFRRRTTCIQIFKIHNTY